MFMLLLRGGQSQKKEAMAPPQPHFFVWRARAAYSQWSRFPSVFHVLLAKTPPIEIGNLSRHPYSMF